MINLLNFTKKSIKHHTFSRILPSKPLHPLLDPSACFPLFPNPNSLKKGNISSISLY